MILYMNQSELQGSLSTSRITFDDTSTSVSLFHTALLNPLAVLHLPRNTRTSRGTLFGHSFLQGPHRKPPGPQEAPGNPIFVCFSYRNLPHRAPPGSQGSQGSPGNHFCSVFLTGISQELNPGPQESPGDLFLVCDCRRIPQ